MTLINESATWGSLLDWAGNFPDNRIVEEIQVLEEMIDTDFMQNSILFDAVLSLYDFLRDECVRRLAAKSQ